MVQGRDLFNPVGSDIKRDERENQAEILRISTGTRIATDVCVLDAKRRLCMRHKLKVRVSLVIYRRQTVDERAVYCPFAFLVSRTRIISLEFQPVFPPLLSTYYTPSLFILPRYPDFLSGFFAYAFPLFNSALCCTQCTHLFVHQGNIARLLYFFLTAIIFSFVCEQMRAA